MLKVLISLLFLASCTTADKYCNASAVCKEFCEETCSLADRTKRLGCDPFVLEFYGDYDYGCYCRNNTDAIIYCSADSIFNKK